MRTRWRATFLPLDRGPASAGLSLRALIRRSCLEAIVGGRLGQGERLPSARQLARDWHVSRTTVDDALAPGIGRRLDGRANPALDVGAILALSPALDDATRAEFSSWGPGKYDPRHHYFDGTAIVPLNRNASCGTIPICDRSEDAVTPRRSWPSTSTRPDVGS